MTQAAFNYIIENESDQHKPWLVLVNGLFAPLESWAEVVQGLCENYRVLRYDGPGQGKGPKWEGVYSLDRLTTYLSELLDHLNITKCSFIGLSNGGRISLHFATLYPERVEAIVAADTYAQTSELLKRKLNSWLQANRIGGPTHRFDVATPWIWGESIVNERPELLDYYRDRAALADDEIIEGLITGAMQEKSISLESLSCPVLYIAGKEDVLTPGFIHKAMAAQTTSSDFVEVAGGHASLLEYPATMKEVILPWLVAQGQLKIAKQAQANGQRQGGLYGMD